MDFKIAWLIRHGAVIFCLRISGKNGLLCRRSLFHFVTRWTHINTALEFGQPDPLETYSSSKHLFVDLNIPEGTKGRIRATSKVEGSGSGSSNSASRDGKHAGVHSRDGNSGPGHQRGDRNRSRGGSKPHAAGSGDGAPTGAAETHGDHEHKTPSAGNRNRQRRRTRGGSGSSPG